mgnify:CR=1 FL=1
MSKLITAPLTRFWPNIKKTPSCWLWQGDKYKQGYGRIGQGGHSRKILAHRLSWEIHNGPIPRDICVLHHCDNPPCVNPDHLWLGSIKDNHRDMRAKLRHAFGERHGRAKLNEQKIIKIKKMLKAGVTHKVIAGRFRVSRSVITQIALKKTWRNYV